jgi:hypothetical protein
MNDRAILEKYVGRNGQNGIDSSLAADADLADDMGSFGLLRGVRDKAIMLELRRKTGVIRAVGYGYIERVDYDASDGIAIQVLGQTIRLKGRNLNTAVRPAVTLFGSICRHRVAWIQEADQATILKSERTAVVLESIEW